MRLRSVLPGLVVLAFYFPVHAQELNLDAPRLASSTSPHTGASEQFGPLIQIEKIELKGNSATKAEVILSAIPLKEGDKLHSGDPQLEASRYRILALGFFRNVKLSLYKGSERGKVVLLIEVEERGTFVLNRMFFGTSVSTPWWGGLDIGDRNFLGTGVNVSAAGVVTGKGRPDGSRAQNSFVLRASDSAFFGSGFGWQASGYRVLASEPFQVAGEPSDSRPENFRAFDYNRIGGRGGFSRRITSLARAHFGARLERVRATLPINAVQVLPNGETRPVDLHLKDGTSHVLSFYSSYDRDTRSDPVLPWRGDRLLVHGGFSAEALASDYNFATLLAKYEKWWPVGGSTHVLSLHLSGGAVLGNVPQFERLHVGDINRMVSPRALGLVTSTTPSLDILNTSTDEIRYGEIGGLAEVQYSYKLFRSKKYVYGGEIFVGAGLWTLATTADIDPRDSPPIDILLDAGLRLDSEIGIFELSLANGLGRLPL
jgi:outer membrane protein assembly factor BamA